MKRAVKPCSASRPEYPTLKALVLGGTLLLGGAAPADVAVPDKGKVRAPIFRGQAVAPVPLPPGLPPRPQPVVVSPEPQPVVLPPPPQVLPPRPQVKTAGRGR